MKKLFFLLLITAFVSCKDDEKPVFDLHRTVNIREASVPGLRSMTVDTVHLSAKEIVKQCCGIYFYNYARYGDEWVNAGFDAAQRDTVTPCLKMWATQIINPMTGYYPGFIEGEDMVLCRTFTGRELDTIAYIPNSVLRAAQVAIKDNYDAGNYEAVYKLFDTAMTFIPITGEEWRALKAKNEQ